MEKKRNAKKGRSAKIKRRYIQNRAAIIGISGVVCMLLVVLLFEGHSLQGRIQTNQEKMRTLQEQMEAEEARTGEIEELQDYMQSDEYIEKIAKEKIGLVKDNEIIFKENK